MNKKNFFDAALLLGLACLITAIVLLINRWSSRVWLVIHFIIIVSLFVNGGVILVFFDRLKNLKKGLLASDTVKKRSFITVSLILLLFQLFVISLLITEIGERPDLLLDVTLGYSTVVGLICNIGLLFYLTEPGNTREKGE